MKFNNIIEALKFRYATKIFDTEKKIPEHDFNELLEVLRLAPSSYGVQPWKFIVVEDKELRSKIRSRAWNQVQVTEASHLIVLCAKKDITEKDIDNYIEDIAKTRNVDIKSLDSFKGYITSFRKGVDAHFIENWAKRQVYIALGMLLESAALKGIDTCPMEGFDPKGVDEVLGLTHSEFTSVALCNLGYRSIKDKYSGNTKVRYSKNKVIEFM